MEGSRSALYVVLGLKFLESAAYFTLNNIFTLHLTEELGLSDSQAGLLFGLRGALTTLYASLLGPLIDHFGVARAAQLAFLLAGCGRAVFAKAQTSWLALVAVCGPMAMGHGLLAPALAIGVKRTAGGDAEAWGLLYLATVLGILLCGPAIDIATMLWPPPARPYRWLALGTALLSAIGFVLSSASTALTDAAQGEQIRPGDAPRRAWAEAFEAVLNKRFLRFCAYSVAILPGCSVIRNLDGGIFPKFMLRTYGPKVPRGTIYAMNPLLDLIAVPPVSRRTKSYGHFEMSRVGLTVAAVSPMVLAMAPGASNGAAAVGFVVAFVLVLTAGDVLYNPRVDAYAMAVAPPGREGAFAGVSSAVVFLADVPTGMLGGALLEAHCPGSSAVGNSTVAEAPVCDARSLFGWLALFSCLTPCLLWLFPVLFQEPLEEGKDASTAAAARAGDTDEEMIFCSESGPRVLGRQQARTEAPAE